jgi:hypothetical protein
MEKNRETLIMINYRLSDFKFFDYFHRKGFPAFCIDIYLCQW